MGKTIMGNLKTSAKPGPKGSDDAALVLSGGGITGFLYEVGVLAALEQALPRPPLARWFGTFVGTSAGAVAAALFANGASALEMYGALNADRDSPFNFRPRDVFGVAGRNLAHLLTQFLTPLLGTLRRTIAGGRPSLAAMLADFQEHHPPGFYSTEPLERTLCSRFDDLGFAHRFHELKSRLYVTGTDIDSGERLVFGADPLRDVHICRAVAASCAIPIFFRPIRIEERDVVDGAIAETTPIDIAVEHGARRVLYLNPMVPIRNDRTKLCLPLDGGHCARLSEKGVGWVGEQALRLLLAAKLDQALSALRAGHPDLVVRTIHPARDEMPMFMHNVMSFAARKELLAYGYACGQRALAAGTLALLSGAAPSDAPTAA
jgi:predicted acylesterase/phospholipase RssA